MSHLDVPRLAFCGRFVANVGTANNDYEGVSPPPVDVANARLDPGGRSPADLRRWLEQPLEDRSSAVTLDKRDMWLRSGWNYFGDNGCWFEDVVATSVTLPHSVAMSRHEDAVVGASVRLNRAVMVDLDPHGNDSTQIFAEEIEIAGPDGLRVSGKPTRMVSRGLRFGRNLGLDRFSSASAVFHASIAEPVVFAGASAWAVALGEALAGPGVEGLAVRFCVYAVEFPIPMADLRDRYVDRQHPQNPGMGWMVGALAPRRAGEPSSFALGRHLVPTSVAKTSPGLGDALALVDAERRVVCIDLQSTFPEVDRSRRKVDFGAARLVVEVDGGGGERSLGEVEYDRATYEHFGGIVEVPLTKDEVRVARAGRLGLRTTEPERRLREQDVMVDTDDRCTYLSPGAHADIRLQARPGGAGRPADVTLTVTVDPPGASSPVRAPATVVVPAGEEASFTVTGLAPGVATLTLRPPGGAGEMCHAHVRVLPADDHLDDEEPTFAALRREVLDYYDVIHPAMSMCVLDLVDENLWSDPGFCDRVLDRLGRDFESFAYMPRTRELSGGKRRLLERWCRRILDGSPS